VRDEPTPAAPAPPVAPPHARLVHYADLIALLARAP
jgi:hypothetical protein